MSHENSSRHELIARGVIIQDGAILVNRGRNAKTGVEYFALPGGHIDPGESSRTAVERELEEELNAKVSVGELVFVSESIYPGRHEDDGRRQEIVLYFAATLQSELHEENGIIASPEADKRFCWLPMSDVPASNVLPRTVKEFLVKPEVPLYGFSDDT
ncbi:MAG TPA: NUDIX domain-containing protein [Abditibacteriaceae bacterium]|jgi:ADP-ribose pyrophosphatase YjhB (NUDIX family)